MADSGTRQPRNAFTDWSRGGLEAAGFTGFGLFADLVGVEVPAAPGARLVTWPPPDQPPFLPAARLGGSWAAIPPCRSQCCSCLVAASRVLWYIGEAIGGSTGRRGLRKRLDEFRGYGQGEPVGHRGEDSAASLKKVT